MIRSLDRAVIDEIQRAPELLLTGGDGSSTTYASSRAQGTGSIPIQGRRRAVHLEAAGTRMIYVEAGWKMDGGRRGGWWESSFFPRG